jgi:hypothetical protein
MKKHILGVSLFVSIVGISGLVYCILTQDNSIEKTFAISTNQADQILVKQAVLNLKTKKITWEMAKSDLNTPIVLHFFVVDENGAEYLASKNAPSGDEITTSYRWLNNLKSYDNLYVMADIIDSKSAILSSTELFDPAKATAVLLNSGK